MDNRSKLYVFVPFCLLAQGYQAEGLVKYEWKSSIRPIVNLLLDNNINIIQMPCIEAEYHNSLVRKPMGLSKYNNDDFNKHAEELACNVEKQIREIVKANYCVLAIMGIEQSPSCTVNYIYTNKGMEKRMGLFIEKLNNKIKDLDIPIIGINRKYINKSIEQLMKVIEENKTCTKKL